MTLAKKKKLIDKLKSLIPNNKLDSLVNLNLKNQIPKKSQSSSQKKYFSFGILIFFYLTLTRESNFL